MRGTEKHSTKSQGAGGRCSTRSNRTTGRSSRKEAAPPPTSTTRSHHHQTQAPVPPPTNEQNLGPFEHLPNLLPPTTTGMAPSEPSNIEPSLQTLPMSQPYLSTTSSAPLDNDTSALLPSPGATTPTTRASLPSPPPNNNANTTSMPDYPQSAYNYGTWTAEEDKTLLNARGQGHHWAQIQRTHFPSKTANACRKRYERLMERRGIYDLDREKLEKVAHEYMGMRKEIWANLAARVGERWNVVEAQCMSSGLRTIQLNARSHARRQRHESRVSQRSSAAAQQHYPYLNTADNGMLDMINHHHQHPGGHGGSIGNTLLAPVGFAPISPLDDDHPGPHRRPDQTYNHTQQGGWHNGQQQQHHHQQQGYGNSGYNSASGTPTAEMVRPTASTSSAEQGQGYRDYAQHHQPQYPSYGPGPPSSSAMDPHMAPSMGYSIGYNIPGSSHRR